MNFKVYIVEDSLKSLGLDMQNLGEAFKIKAQATLKTVATQAHGFIVTEVQSKLQSTRDLYLSSLVGPYPEGDNIWVVGLKKDAEWVEEGYSAHDMLHDLVNGPKSKVSKSGHRYNVIPFRFSGGKSSMTRSQGQMADFVKAELKKRGLDRIVKDSQGNAKQGKVASVNLNGPSWSISKHGTNMLSGISIYQKTHTTKGGKEKTSRDVFTFRVASEKQEGTGKWFNKGYGGAHIFQKVSTQIDEAWNKAIVDLLRD